MIQKKKKKSKVQNEKCNVGQLDIFCQMNAEIKWC